MRVLSLGAGVQSSTLLLMAVHGEIQLDRAIFADTQWEPAAVYAWLETLMPIAERAGIPVDIVTAGNIREDALAGKTESWMPLHIVNLKGEAGMAKRQCSKNYKLVPIKRRIRELIGRKRSATATAIIGISRDEGHRMAPSRVQWLTNEYPLVDRHMTRRDCVAWLARHGYPEPPKSSCLGCPYKSDRQWRALLDESPNEWADVEAYLHRSLKPLPMVDLSTPQDHGQLEMFGECDGFSCMAPGDIA